VKYIPSGKQRKFFEMFVTTYLFMSEAFKGLMFDCHKQYTNLEGQRSHECERGTQECVRHNDSKTK
jgi:hypothetical protein